MEDFITALCRYFSNRENLIIVSSHAIGNYVVQTLLNNYGRDPRTEPILQVLPADQLLRENLEPICQNEYGYKMINNLHSLLDLKDFTQGRRNGGSGARGAQRGRGGHAGPRKDAGYDPRQAGRPQDQSYAQHGGYGSSMGQMPMQMFFVQQTPPGQLHGHPYYGMGVNPNTAPGYPQQYSGYNYFAPEGQPAPKRLRGGNPRSL